MQKKLQVFISSTYTDLIEERQVAVEAVLNSGHIPAGMELFKSGDVSQKEIIKKWIDESDAYMLIMGGRYGTIDKESGKSYTHWEYDYAGEIGKPRFAIVITDKALEQKVKDNGSHVMERDNYPLYQEFRKQVLDKISKFFSEKKDIKLVVYESLKELEKRDDLHGWISGKEIEDSKNIKKENYDLLKENTELKKQLEKIKNEQTKKNDLEGHSFEEVYTYLSKAKVVIPDGLFSDKKYDGQTISLYKIFRTYEAEFAVGISNNMGMSKIDKFLFFDIGPLLMKFGLVEKVKLAGSQAQRVQTAKLGLKFLRLAVLRVNEESKKKEPNKA